MLTSMEEFLFETQERASEQYSFLECGDSTARHRPEGLLTIVEDFSFPDERAQRVVDELLRGQRRVVVPPLQARTDGLQGGRVAGVVELRDDQAEGVRQRDELRLRDHLHLDAVHVTCNSHQVP